MSASPRTLTLVVFGSFSLSILIAIWGLPGFLVQDSPLYLYNTRLMLELRNSSSPFHRYFTMDWRPLPYWGAHALLGGLMSVLPARTADQVLMSITSVGVATAGMWLRWRLAGWQGAAVIGLLTIVISINVLWMYGLHSFLFGSIIYFITVGYWWQVRSGVGPMQSLVLAGLLIAGYFCHLVSFGLAGFGVLVLCLLTPGPNVRRRFLWTVASFLPALPFGIFYVHAMAAVGESGLHWRGMTNALSLAEWLRYVSMADFPTIHTTGTVISGGGLLQFLFLVPPPSRLVLIGLAALAGSAFLYRSEDDLQFYRLHRGWVLLAFLLLIGGAFGPGEVGSAQGFLRERLLLLGCLTMLPLLRIKTRPVLSRAGIGVIALAASVQVALLWDYGLRTNRLVTEFLGARPHVGTGQRVAGVVVTEPWPYRTNPLLHLPNLLGLEGDNLVWNNYAPALFYFPLKYRETEAKQLSLKLGNDLHFQDFLGTDARQVAEDVYRQLMERDHSAIDVLVVWSATAGLDSLNRRWFEASPQFRSPHLSVVRHLGR